MKKITINDVLNQVNGIGVSKAEFRKTTGLKSENNQNYSDKIHSFGSKSNFERFLVDITNFAKNSGFQNSVQRLDKINEQIFKNYIKNKIEGGITKKNAFEHNIASSKTFYSA